MIEADGFLTSLRSGKVVRVRPIQPADKSSLTAGYEQLSDESRYARFLAKRDSLNERLLAYLTEIDQVDHVAWGVGLPDHKVGEPGIAVARFVRLPDAPHVAEFALTVADDYQRQGVGTLSLALLYHLARQQGDIAKLRGMVGVDNRWMIAWMFLLGANARPVGSGLMQMEIAITNKPELPENRAAQRFCDALWQIETQLAAGFRWAT